MKRKGKRILSVVMCMMLMFSLIATNVPSSAETRDEVQLPYRVYNFYERVDLDEVEVVKVSDVNVQTG